MSRFTPADMPDLTGRTAVITGANSGLGLETARLLAGAGATVVMTARTREKHDAATAQILPTNRAADLEFVRLDLADLASVREAAEQVRSSHASVDILVNNAGVMFTPESTTADGLELQIGTNHFGHFAFTGLLLEPLLAAAGSRVVTVASGAHRQGEMDFDDLHQQRSDGYNSWAQYSRSKLANILFMLHLQHRFEQAPVDIMSIGAHPGYTATNLQSAGVKLPGRSLLLRVADVAMKVMTPIVGMSVAQGALPQVYAAVADVDGGSYWGPQGPMEMRGPVGPAAIDKKGRDTADAARLWDISVETTGVDYSALGSSPGPLRQT